MEEASKDKEDDEMEGEETAKREREEEENGSKRELSTGLGARRLPVYCVAQSVIFTNDHHRLLSSSVIIASLG